MKCSIFKLLLFIANIWRIRASEYFEENDSIEQKNCVNKNAYNIPSENIKRIAIVRIIANDSQTSASETTLFNNAFGSDKYNRTIATQMSLCSFKKLTLVPAIPPSGKPGIYNLRIYENVKGVDHMKVKSMIFSNLKGNFDWVDHFFFCVPPGTTGAFLAFASGKHSFYNDGWCLSLSGKMHEFGHNLGLEHSNKPNQKYGDVSGYMGYSTVSSYKPIMCYGAAQTYKLNWFADKTKHLSMDMGQTSLLTLHGFVDYDIAKIVLIRLFDNKSTNNFFISYNSNKRHNNGTNTGANKVLITSSKLDGSGSLLLAIMSVGERIYLDSKYNCSYKYTISWIHAPTDSTAIIETKPFNIEQT